MRIGLTPQVRRAARRVGIRSAGTWWRPWRNGSTGSQKEVTQNHDAVRAIELPVVVGIAGLSAGRRAPTVEKKRQDAQTVRDVEDPVSVHVAAMEGDRLALVGDAVPVRVAADGGYGSVLEDRQRPIVPEVVVRGEEVRPTIGVEVCDRDVVRPV